MLGFWLPSLIKLSVFLGETKESKFNVEIIRGDETFFANETIQPAAIV